MSMDVIAEVWRNSTCNSEQERVNLLYEWWLLEKPEKKRKKSTTTTLWKAQGEGKGDSSGVVSPLGCTTTRWRS